MQVRLHSCCDLSSRRFKNEADIEVGGQLRPAVEPGAPVEIPEVGLSWQPDGGGQGWAAVVRETNSQMRMGG